MKFTKNQHKTWGVLFTRQLPNIKKHASKQFLEGLAVLPFKADSIPEIDDLNMVIEPRTGWKAVHTVTRYLSDTQWASAMSRQKFPITRYIRSMNELDFTPEPDMFHDLFGHQPLLAAKESAELMDIFSAIYNKIPKERIFDVAQIFWYTFEFGLIKEEGRIKAFGAGLMSSFGELNEFADGKIAIEPFSVHAAIKTPRAVYSMHKKLFLIESIPTLKKQLTEFLNSL